MRNLARLTNAANRLQAHHDWEAQPGGDTPRFNSLLKARCMVTEIGREEADWMIRRHYLRKWPGVEMLTLGLWRDCFVVGVMVFALPPRETMTRYGGYTWELARLWVDDSMPYNSESWFIGQAFAHLRQVYRQVEYLVSYADPSFGHIGTIYKATNWIADGRTDDERKSPRCDYEHEGKRYSRRSHLPSNVIPIRVPRMSKFRFYYPLGSTKG